MKKLPDRLLDIFMVVYPLFICIVVVAVIPGLVWAIIELILMILGKIFIRLGWFLGLSWWIRGPIDIVGGLCLNIWVHERNKQAEKDRACHRKIQ